MPSPFPGMDPYLERYWGDIHASLIVYARDALQEKLPAGLFARVEERVSIESTADRRRSIYPDVRVVEPRGQSAGSFLIEPAQAKATTSGVAVAKPFKIRLRTASFVQGFIEVFDHALGGKVVTSIEIISPSNKLPGKGRIAFRKKQKRSQAAGVNLVEIDLMRQGEWILSIPQEEIPPEELGLYGYGVVKREDEVTDFDYYAIQVDQPLPPINIPLRPTDEDAVLPLQPLLDRCYDVGRYRQIIDYEADPTPPLEGDDAKWADSHLRKLGLRSSTSTKKRQAANGKQSKRPKKKRG